jgi:hypothetical protein
MAGKKGSHNGAAIDIGRKGGPKRPPLSSSKNAAKAGHDIGRKKS